MNKRKLRHYWKYFRHLKPWYFLLLAVIFGVVCLFALRANSQRMAELRDTLYAADEAGEDVQGPLRDLQAHVTAHMNTSLSTGNGVYPPVQLQYTYERLLQEQSQKQFAGSTDLYSEAQAYCQAQNPTGFSGSGRVPCIQQYVKERGSAITLGPTISPSLYQFDFVAPKWSPDLAGWSLVLAIISLIAAVVIFLVDVAVKRRLR